MANHDYLSYMAEKLQVGLNIHMAIAKANEHHAKVGSGSNPEQLELDKKYAMAYGQAAQSAVEELVSEYKVASALDAKLYQLLYKPDKDKILEKLTDIVNDIQAIQNMTPANNDLPLTEQLNAAMLRVYYMNQLFAKIKDGGVLLEKSVSYDSEKLFSDLVYDGNKMLCFIAYIKNVDLVRDLIEAAQKETIASKQYVALLDSHVYALLYDKQGLECQSKFANKTDADIFIAKAIYLEGLELKEAFAQGKELEKNLLDENMIPIGEMAETLLAEAA